MESGASLYRGELKDRTVIVRNRICITSIYKLDKLNGAGSGSIIQREQGGEELNELKLRRIDTDYEMHPRLFMFF